MKKLIPDMSDGIIHVNCYKNHRMALLTPVSVRAPALSTVLKHSGALRALKAFHSHSSVAFLLLSEQRQCFLKEGTSDVSYITANARCVVSVIRSRRGAAFGSVNAQWGSASVGPIHILPHYLRTRTVAFLDLLQSLLGNYNQNELISPTKWSGDYFSQQFSDV